jgi:hypothetical protein
LHKGFVEGFKRLESFKLNLPVNYSTWSELGGVAMFKKLTEKLFGKDTAGSTSDGFFLNVRCSDCGEAFKLFINKSYELMQNFEENGSVTYALKKEIYGVGCKNRILVNMKFDGGKKLVSREIKNGEFIEDQP